MKTLATNYTFSASNKQVQINGFPGLLLNQILLITNVTRNVIIYNFADSTAGGSLSGTTLTLIYDTTGMSDTDVLQIFVDDLKNPSTETSLLSVDNRLNSLTNTISSNLSSIRISPVYVDNDSVSRYNGHIPVGGRYVDASSFTPTTTIYTASSLSGFDATLNIDSYTGGAMILQGDLDKDIDSVTVFDVGYTSISNFLSSTVVGNDTIGVQVLTANNNRVSFFGQNLGTLPLLVKFGLGCNTSSFNLILSPGVSIFDGTGEKLVNDKYKGDVSINTITPNTSSYYIFWEGV